MLGSIYYKKNLLIDLVTGLLILTNWKGNSYDLILVIDNWLIKIVYYKPVKVIINISSLAKVIINVIVRYHGLLNLIVSNSKFLFISKF